MSWLWSRERKFDALRQRAFEEAEQAFSRPYLRFTGITGTALQYWRREWRQWYRSDRDHFPWDELRQKLSRPHRFDVAMWGGEDLCGMAIGECAGRTALNIFYIEATQRPGHQLQGSIVTLLGPIAVNFAHLAGLQVVRILHPNPAMAKQAAKLGFDRQPAAQGLPVRCERSISHT